MEVLHFVGVCVEMMVVVKFTDKYIFFLISSYYILKSRATGDRTQDLLRVKQT